MPANLLRPTSSARRCSLALLVHKSLLSGTNVQILTPEELPSKPAERGRGKGGGGGGGSHSGSSRRQTPSNSLGTSLPGDSLHAHIAQVEAKGRSEDTLLSPDSFSVLEPSGLGGLPPAFPRPPLPNALLAQQQQKQPQQQTQEQKQAAAEAAAAKRAEEARLKRVEAEAGAPLYAHT